MSWIKNKPGLTFTILLFFCSVIYSIRSEIKNSKALTEKTDSLQQVVKDFSIQKTLAEKYADSTKVLKAELQTSMLQNIELNLKIKSANGNVKRNVIVLRKLEADRDSLQQQITVTVKQNRTLEWNDLLNKKNKSIDSLTAVIFSQDTLHLQLAYLIQDQVKNINSYKEENSRLDSVRVVNLNELGMINYLVQKRKWRAVKKHFQK